MKHLSARLGYDGRLLFAQMLLIGGLSCEVGAAPLGVGYRETLNLFVQEGATSTLTDRLWVAEGALNKTGAGTLALASSNLTVQSGGKLVVRDGTLRVEQGADTGAAPAPRPAEVMAQAAFWVDAAANVIAVSSNDSTYADAWLDVRETSPSGPYTYVRAVADWSRTNCSPQVVMHAGPGGQQPSIWFAGYGSRRSMKWTTPSGQVADIGNLCHVFLVHGVFASNGFILGAEPGTTSDFHNSDLGGGGVNYPIWNAAEWSTTAARQGRTYLDGERVDGTVVYPKQGWQLLEVAFGPLTAHASNFYNDRNIDFAGVRIGGDNLCEAAVFTNRLSETDRLRVQQYLLQKWRGRPSIAALAVSASASGTVVADVASGASMTNRLNGEGSLLKQGGGTVVLDDVPAVKNLFRSASILDGVVDARVPVPLALSAGSRVTAADTLLTLAQDAGSGRLVKDGSGTVTLTAIPQNVSRLSVAAGALVLTPPSTNVTLASQVEGAIPNAGFEAEQLPLGAPYFLGDGATYHGWTAHFPAGPYNAVFIFNKAMDTWGWPCDYLAPEGNQTLGMKCDSSVSTTLTLPVAGIYDLSLSTSGRTGYGNNEFDLCIVDNGATNRVATVQTMPLPYVRQTFRLPWLAAGDHTMLLKSTVQGHDSLGMVDDFKAQLVSEKQPGPQKILNGDFELTTYPRDPAAFTSSNLAEGWVFTANAGITMPASSSRFYTPSSAYGAVLLGLVADGSASATLTLPAGTYRLQGDVCNWPCDLIHNGNWLRDTQSIQATVTRSSSEVVALGTVTTTASMLSATVWPTAFSVTNNEAVTLTLAGQTTQSGGLVDNLVFVPAPAPIVKNGSCDTESDWTFEFDNGILTYARAEYSWWPDIHCGNAYYDGPRRLKLVQTGAAVQDIQIPAAGLYRLVFHATRRYDMQFGDNYGKNPVRAWLAQGGVTNVIGWTRADDAVFVRREFLFLVAAVGTYRFGLQGMTDNSEAFPGTDQSTLVDGVSIEPVTDLDAAGLALPRELALSVDADARLQLSFTGIQNVEEVRYAGKLVEGLLNQQTHPEFISGPGALYAFPKGTMLLLR